MVVGDEEEVDLMVTMGSVVVGEAGTVGGGVADSVPVVMGLSRSTSSRKATAEK